jgi:hypothetical protein
VRSYGLSSADSSTNGPSYDLARNFFLRRPRLRCISGSILVDDILQPVQNARAAGGRSLKGKGRAKGSEYCLPLANGCARRIDEVLGIGDGGGSTVLTGQADATQHCESCTLSFEWLGR